MDASMCLKGGESMDVIGSPNYRFWLETHNPIDTIRLSEAQAGRMIWRTQGTQHGSRIGRHQHTTHLVIAAHAPDRAEIICCRIEYQREGGETNSSNIDPFKSLLCFPGQDESFKRFYSINYTSTHKNSKTLHHGEIITHSFAGAGSGRESFDWLESLVLACKPEQTQSYQ